MLRHLLTDHRRPSVSMEVPCLKEGDPPAGRPVASKPHGRPFRDVRRPYESAAL